MKGSFENSPAFTKLLFLALVAVVCMLAAFGVSSVYLLCVGDASSPANLRTALFLQNSILFVGLMLLGVVSLVILLIKKREFFQTNYNAPMLLPLSTRLMAFITNPGFVAFFALFFLSSVESLLTW